MPHETRVNGGDENTNVDNIERPPNGHSSQRRVVEKRGTKGEKILRTLAGSRSHGTGTQIRTRAAATRPSRRKRHQTPAPPARRSHSTPDHAPPSQRTRDSNAHEAHRRLRALATLGGQRPCSTRNTKRRQRIGHSAASPQQPEHATRPQKRSRQRDADHKPKAYFFFSMLFFFFRFPNVKRKTKASQKKAELLEAFKTRAVDRQDGSRRSARCIRYSIAMSSPRADRPLKRQNGPSRSNDEDAKGVNACCTHARTTLHTPPSPLRRDRNRSAGRLPKHPEENGHGTPLTHVPAISLTPPLREERR
eukprot:Opistho-1_new@101190